MKLLVLIPICWLYNRFPSGTLIIGAGSYYTSRTTNQFLGFLVIVAINKDSLIRLKSSIYGYDEMVIR